MIEKKVGNIISINYRNDIKKNSWGVLMRCNFRPLVTKSFMKIYGKDNNKSWSNLR